MKTAIQVVLMPKILFSAFLLIAIVNQTVWASASGQFEHSNNPSAAFGSGSSCAACHFTTTHTGYSAAIMKNGSSSFPRLNNSSSYTDLSFRLTRGSVGVQASGAGFGLSVTSGTLIAQGGQNTKVKTTADNGGTSDASIGKEIVHSSKKTNSSNSYIWNYTWTTPSTVGNYTFYACGNPVNDLGTEADDGTVRCTSNTVTVNTAPTAANDPSITHTEDGGTKIISPLSNDTAGGDGDTKTLVGYCLQGTANTSCTNTSSGFSLGVPGTLSKSGDNIIYTPANNYNGSFTFEYRMQDSAGSTSNAEITVTVSAVSDSSPNPAADNIAVVEGATITTLVGGASSVLSNDGGLTDTPVTVSVVSPPIHAASFTLNSDGTFSYTHNGSENFTDNFTYKVTDLDGQNSNATVSIAVSKVSDSTPIANTDSIALAEGGTATTLVGGSNNVTDNDTGLLDTPVLVSVLSPPSQASAFNLNSNGSFSYQHNGSDTLSDSFTYRLTDNDGQTSNATVNISATNVNDQPTAINDTLGSVVEDSGANAFDVLSNDVDSDAGDSQEIIAFCATASSDAACTNTSYTMSGQGSVTLSSTTLDNQAVFTPANHYNGPFAFKYKMRDAAGLTSTATASLNVTAQNDPPLAVADTPAAVNEDTSNNSFNVLSNDTDVDLSREGDTQQIIALCAPTTANAASCTTDIYSDANGALSISANTINNRVLFTPTSNYSGPFSFKYKMQDSNGAVSMALVSTTVLAVSDSTPVANIESISLNEGATATSLVGGASSVLSNDTGLTDTPITITQLSSPVHASAFSFNTNDGTFSYQHNGSENFSDSFSYQIKDLDGELDTAFVSISIIATSDSTPSALADSISLAEGGTTAVLTNSNTSVIDNDAGLLDTPIVVTPLNNPNFASNFTLNPNGTFSYQHDGSENFNDSFSYTITDNDGQTANGLVSIVISKVSDSTPAALNDSITITEGGTATALVGGANNVTSNDTGLLDTPIVISLKTAPNQAAAFTLNNNGTFSYTHNESEIHSDSFVYTLTDNDGQSVDGIVNISISNVNDMPLALADNSFSDVLEDSSNNLLDVLANDTDPDAGDTKRIIALCAKGTTDIACTSNTYTAAMGTVTLNSADINNQVLFNPALNENGLFEFKYIMQDTAGSQSSAEVSVTIRAVNDAPQITSISPNSVVELVQYQYQVIVNDPDDTGTGLAYSLIGAPIDMQVTLNGGLITWTPGEDSANTYNFSVQVEDGREDSATPALEAITLIVTTADRDLDTIADYEDNCPDTANTDQANNDLDTEGDLCDLDDDNDTILDSFELANGLDPFDASDAGLDNDGDGLTNAEEAAQGSNPNADTVPPVISADTINIDASAVLTTVDLAASALDALDGVININTNSDTGPFLSGSHTVSWFAQDQAGNIANLDQIVNIAPIVSVAASQVSGEGRTLNLTVELSGPAAIYPVSINYLVSGSASAPLDHDLLMGQIDINAGISATLPVNIASDSLIEGTEEIIVTLDTASNAVVGVQKQQIITIVEQQVPPLVSLSVNQGGSNSIYIYKDQGMVTLTANTSDANGDTLSYDWSAVDDISFNPMPTVNSSSVVFDPSSLASRLYSIPVSVSDGNNNVTHTLNLLLQDTLTPLTTADSDGDGVDDVTEGASDSDSNGLPDFLDPIIQNHVLSIFVSPLENNYINTMQTEAGLSLRLGSRAIAAQTSGAQVSIEDIQKSIEDPQTSDSVATDSAYTPISSLFDFEIHGLNSIKNTAKIVIPLSINLPANAVYRKFDLASGWNNFVEDSENSIKSANSIEGVCPDIMNEDYVNGLQAFANCLELTIKDGGPNDADGLANGVIVDPGGISIPNSNTPDSLIEANIAQTAEINDSVKAGGSSSFNIIFLGLFLIIGLLPFVKQK